MLVKFVYLYKDGRIGLLTLLAAVNISLRDAALAACPDQSAQLKALVEVNDADDLKAFSGGDLVKLYNIIENAAHATISVTYVKKFENLSKAISRTFAKIARASDAPAVEQPATPPKEDEVKKSKKAAKPKKVREKKTAPTGPNANVVKTLSLIERANGATLDEIIEALGVTKGSARNIVGDARRALIAEDKTKTISVEEINANRRAYRIVAA